MLRNYLRDRELRGNLSIMLGMLLSALYITSNILFCLIYEGVWYLTLAVYNLLLLLCRYYSFGNSDKPALLMQSEQKINFILITASAVMSLAIISSALTESFKTRSPFAFGVAVVYTVFSSFRIVLIPLRKKTEENHIRALLDRLRILSFLTSFHGITLHLIYAMEGYCEGSYVLAFVSAFFVSYFSLVCSVRKRCK